MPDDNRSGATAPVAVPVDVDGVRLQVLARPDSAAGFGDESAIGARRPTMETIVAGMASVARSVGEQLRSSGADRMTVEFGCDIAMESGALVAAIGKASTTSAFTVTLEWEKPSG